MLLNHRDDVSPKLPVTVYGSIVGWGRPSLLTMFGLWVNPSLCLLRGRPACFVARSEGSRSGRAFFVISNAASSGGNPRRLAARDACVFGARFEV